MISSVPLFQSPAGGSVDLEEYAGIAPDGQIDDIRQLAAELRGLRVVHLNSTGDGGGVAEILRSMVPLMRGIGLDVDWRVIPGDDAFFQVTKQMHNQLQGAEGTLSDSFFNLYIDHVRSVTDELQRQRIGADVWMMHDPQTLPMATFLPPAERAIWICHIDTTSPNPSLAQRVMPWLEPYARWLFSLDTFVFPGLPAARVRIIQPAIDPLREKNRALPPEAVTETLQRAGMDTSRPIITQVARFDRWKDPLGLIDAYRMLKGNMPRLQLALLGVITARDDPEAFAVLEEVRDYAGDDPDIHLFDDPAIIGEREVAAFQQGADVVIQKSLREGFGLSVTEALWKGSPTVAGRCGGIQVQIVDGETGFLVSTPAECADRVGLLLQDRDLALRIGAAGRERVRQNFLLPRLLRDYLAVLKDAMSGAKAPVSPILPAARLEHPAA